MENQRFEHGGLEGGHFEEKPKGNETGRLSQEEALLYQEYATKIANKEFNEQSDEGSYQEAEELIDKLKDEKFDFLGIDWDKVKVGDINKISEAEQRLDFVIRQLVIDGKDHGGVLAGLADKFKSAVIPLVAAFAVFSAGEFPKDAMAESVAVYQKGHMENEGKVNIVIDERLEVTEGRISKNHEFEMKVNITSSIKKWLLENPDTANQIDAIVVETAVDERTWPDASLKKDGLITEQEGTKDFSSHFSADKAKAMGEYKGEVWKAYARPVVIVVTKDHRVFKAKGSVSGNFARVGDHEESIQNILSEMYGGGMIEALETIKNEITIDGNTSKYGGR